MMTVTWVFAVAGLFLQLLNIVWVFSSARASQVYLVPALLWYVGLVLRGKGFFLQSSGQEILWVLGIHIVFCVLLAVLGKAARRM